MLTLSSPWSTGDPNQVEDPFNYDEEVAAQVLEGLLAKDQIVHMNFVQLFMIAKSTG